MSNLNEVYGTSFKADALALRQKHLIDLITNNISHREFVFHLDGCENIWNGNCFAPGIADTICSRVQEKNHCLKVRRVDLKRKDHRSLLPYLIENEPAEYFYIVDSEFNRMYLIFITPNLMGAF